MTKTKATKAIPPLVEKPEPPVGSNEWRALYLRRLKMEVALIRIDQADVDNQIATLRSHGASDGEIKAAIGPSDRPAVFELATKEGLRFYVHAPEVEAAVSAAQDRGLQTRTQRIALPADAGVFADLLQSIADRCFKAARRPARESD